MHLCLRCGEATGQQAVECSRCGAVMPGRLGFGIKCGESQVITSPKGVAELTGRDSPHQLERELVKAMEQKNENPDVFN